MHYLRFGDFSWTKYSNFKRTYFSASTKEKNSKTEYNNNKKDYLSIITTNYLQLNFIFKNKFQKDQDYFIL